MNRLFVGLIIATLFCSGCSNSRTWNDDYLIESSHTEKISFERIYMIGPNTFIIFEKVDGLNGEINGTVYPRYLQPFDRLGQKRKDTIIKTDIPPDSRNYAEIFWEKSNQTTWYWRVIYHIKSLDEILPWNNLERLKISMSERKN